MVQWVCLLQGVLALQSAQFGCAWRHDVVGWGDVGLLGTVLAVSIGLRWWDRDDLPSVGKLGLKHLTVVVHVLGIFRTLHLRLQLSVRSVRIHISEDVVGHFRCGLAENSLRGGVMECSGSKLGCGSVQKRLALVFEDVLN